MRRVDSQAAVDWLLRSDEPAIRYLTRRDVLGEHQKVEPNEILSGPKVSALLDGQQADGGFGRNPYRKFTGAHWRLISLAELEVPPSDPRVAAAAEHILTWLMGKNRHRGKATVIDGLARVHSCIDGNALAACCRLGLAGDDRARTVAESLLEWQWPDGGWNSDRTASGRRSSFHESLPAAWGLHEYAQITGDSPARAAVSRATELFLEHRLLFALKTGRPIRTQWLQLRYPSYWHYDMLRVLLLLSRIGEVRDDRARDALDELERRRLPDGRWAADGQWWKPAPSVGSPEAVDWGETGQPNEMITLDALRVLRAAGRLESH